MIILPNGCKCSDFNVFLKNWKTQKATLKINWYISYRFYDPLSEKYPKGKLIVIKGMNKIKDLPGRQQITQGLLDDELNSLLNKGHNPITGQSITPIDTEYEISRSTPFIKALRLAMARLKCEKETIMDMTSVLKYFEKSAIQLRYADLPIFKITKKHVRFTLDYCQNLKDDNGKPKTWNASQFNHYRKYLSILFAELCEIDAVDYNPIRDIGKKQTVKKIRETLTDDERNRIDKHLKSDYYPFWRFMQIFFHSGSREKELMNIKASDVDLEKQQFKVVIKKGKQQREALKTIKDIALPLWKEVLENCKPHQYIFSKGLKPGNVKIASNQITRRWNVHVKTKLNITADFYSLKHLNTAETVDLLNSEMAAKMNGHTSTAMVVGIYDVKRKEREHEQLKKLGNKF